MKLNIQQAWRTASGAVAIATLVACGGGGGSTAPTAGGGGGGGIVVPIAATLQGTAATGAALANAPVTITDSTGTSPCEEATITTTALGSYSCTLKAGKTAPFFVVVIDPTGNTAPLVSVQSTTPAAGQNLTVNVTPLTTAILAQLSTDGNPLSVVASRTVDSAALKTITTNVVAQLAAVLSSIGAPAGYDPFTTSITAATASGTGNTADLILDVVRIATDPATGSLALSTIENPTPVLLATATTTGAAVPAVPENVSTLSKATQIAAQAFNSCTAVPAATRATLVNGSIDTVAPECENIVASLENSAGIDYLHNGYAPEQAFYDLLTSSLMTGAQFSVPEIMQFLPSDPQASSSSLARFDRAVLNVKYLDNEGNPGNFITVAARITGSAKTDRPTDWWLTGNQQLVDTSVRLNIRRVEQLSSANSNTNRMSTFQTGIQFNINASANGPGTLFNGAALTLARVNGPGLPAAGIVYKKSTASQNSMDLFNKTGSLTSGAQCGNGNSANCPNIWLSRTAGLTGTAAATLAANQPGLLWAQEGDGYDASKVVKGAVYQIELFYGSNTTTADRTVNKTLLSDLVQAQRAVNLPWNTLGPKSIAALDPNGSLAGAQVNSLQLDWLQNQSAQQIGNIQGVINTANQTFGVTRFVPRGALSGVLDNQTIPAFGPTTANRTLLYGYRMLDSSNKTAVYQYN